MILGVAIAAESINLSVRVVDAEPYLTDAAAPGAVRGECVLVIRAVKTVGYALKASIDASRARIVGLKASADALGGEAESRLVDEVITVSEHDNIEASKLVWQRIKIANKLNADVKLTGAKSDRLKGLDLERVGVILCGGITDIKNSLAHLIYLEISAFEHSGAARWIIYLRTS